MPYSEASRDAQEKMQQWHEFFKERLSDVLYRNRPGISAYEDGARRCVSNCMWVPEPALNDVDDLREFAPHGWLSIPLHVAGPGRGSDGIALMFHGTSVDSVSPNSTPLNNAPSNLQLEQARQIAADGAILHAEICDSVRTVPGHIPAKAIWLSPSSLYSGHPVYAREVYYEQPRSAYVPAMYQVIFQGMYDMSGFDEEVRQSKSGKWMSTLRGWMHEGTDVIMDPRVPSNVLELWTVNARHFTITNMLIRSYPCAVNVVYKELQKAHRQRDFLIPPYVRDELLVSHARPASSRWLLFDSVAGTVIPS